MTKPWRVAKALDVLRTQINTLAPRRSKASDGSIGDEAHQATKSGHNPNADGVVVAIDVTHDPAGGCDCNAIFASLIASKDRRIQYLIWNRQIVNREVSPWVIRPYSGPNPHDKHIHIEVDEKAALYDDTFPWTVRTTTMAQPPRPAPIPDVEPVPPPPPRPPATTGAAAGQATGGIGGVAGAGVIVSGVDSGNGWLIAGGLALLALGIVVFIISRRK